MKIYRIAATPDQKIKDLERDIKEIKKDLKGLERETKKVVSELNIGNRRFFQHKTVFTSLQRKIERFEKVEQEWKKYKKEIDDKIRRAVEKKVRGQIS